MEDFEKKLENLTKPDGDVKPPLEIKLAIVNAQRSAVLGVWFTVIPCYFLFCAFMFYFFHLDYGVLGSIFVLFSMLEKNSMWLVGPVILVALPLISIIFNALAITHFSFDRADRMLRLNIKLRWFNIVILLLSLAIVSLFVAYAFALNIQVK
jgi:hypothetical protein